jgi:hypothetical protein
MPKAVKQYGKGMTMREIGAPGSGDLLRGQRRVARREGSRATRRWGSTRGARRTPDTDQ